MIFRWRWRKRSRRSWSRPWDPPILTTLITLWKEVDRRRSSTGGSGAVQGVEVFESVGAAAEELKPKDAFVREVASAALHAALPVAFAKEWSRHPSRGTTSWSRVVCQRCCGVAAALPGSRSRSKIPKAREKAGGKTNRVFSVSQFLDNSSTEAEAELHWRLPRPSVLSWGARASSRSRRSGIPTSPATWCGFLWSKSIQRSHGKRFVVALSPRRQRPRRRPSSSDDLQMQVKAASTWSALPVFHPKLPYRGVKWEQGEQRWPGSQSFGGDEGFHGCFSPSKVNVWSAAVAFQAARWLRLRLERQLSVENPKP